MIFFKFDEKGMLCIRVHGHMVPFYYNDKIGRSIKQFPASRKQFHDIVISVRRNLIDISKSLPQEIREQFPRYELLEAMSTVYPQYWNHSQCSYTLKFDFIEKCNIL